MSDSTCFRCELEEYVFLSSRGAGRVVTAEMEVKVQKITTTTTTTRTTTIARRTTTSTESLIQKWQTSTKATTTITTTTRASPITYTTTESISPNTSTTEMSTESDMIQQNTVNNSNETPKAVPQINKEADNQPEGSSMLVIGVSIFIIILILSTVSLAGFFIYRFGMQVVLYKSLQCIYGRRRSVVKEGAVVYDNSKTEPGSQAVTNISFLDDDGDTSNLHEFFPPNLQIKSS